MSRATDHIDAAMSAIDRGLGATLDDLLGPEDGPYDPDELMPPTGTHDWLMGYWFGVLYIDSGSVDFDSDTIITQLYDDSPIETPFLQQMMSDEASVLAPNGGEFVVHWTSSGILVLDEAIIEGDPDNYRRVDDDD
jgi:hypothetical protein